MNSSVYTSNLEALKKHHPRLAQMVEGLTEIPALSMEKVGQNEWDLRCNMADGKSFLYYNAASPLKYSQELVSKLDFKNPRVIFFLGLGFGHHIVEYARKPHPLNQAVIITETFPHIFKKALELQDLTPLIRSPNVFWFIGSGERELTLFLNQLFSNVNLLAFANAIEYVPLEPALKMTGQFYEALQKLVPQAIGHQFNRYYGDPFDGYVGTENMLANLPLLLKEPIFDKAKNIFKGKPGVLLASGPSLSRAIPFIKEIQDRAVLVACPSALPKLIEAGIQPHIWLNIEKMESQGAFFADLKGKTDHVFVGTPIIHPLCYRGNGGLNTFQLGATLQANWLPFQGERTESGHSSAHAALRILQHLGCDPIFLLGQDLSYTADQSHAEGVWDETRNFMERLQAEGKKILEVEGNDGRPVKTNLFWFTYLKTFAEQILPSHPGKVYNVIPPDFGAKIQGIERLDPENLPSKIEASPLQTLSSLKSALSSPSSSEMERNQKNVLKKIEATIRMIQNLISDSRGFTLKCKETQYSSELGSYQWETAEPRFSSFMKEAQKFLNRYAAGHGSPEEQEAYRNFFFPIIQGTRIRYHIDFFSSASETKGDFKEVAKKLEILFHMVKDESHWASLLLPLLEKARKTLSA